MNILRLLALLSILFPVRTELIISSLLFCAPVGEVSIAQINVQAESDKNDTLYDIELLWEWSDEVSSTEYVSGFILGEMYQFNRTYIYSAAGVYATFFQATVIILEGDTKSSQGDRAAVLIEESSCEYPYNTEMPTSSPAPSMDSTTDSSSSSTSSLDSLNYIISSAILMLAFVGLAFFLM